MKPRVAMFGDVRADNGAVPIAIRSVGWRYRVHRYRRYSHRALLRFCVADIVNTKLRPSPDVKAMQFQLFTLLSPP